MLERKEAEKQRALIAEAAQKEAERKQKFAEKERLEAATTLVEFSQQVFIKEQSTQTETASPSKTVVNCSMQTVGDVTTVVKESEQLKRKLYSRPFSVLPLSEVMILSHNCIQACQHGVCSCIL